MISSQKVQTIYKNRKYHIGFLIFAPCLLIIYSIYLNNWYFFFLLTKLFFIAAIHEMIHYFVAKYYGWHAHFKLTARTYYQPAIHLEPNSILYARQYGMIAFAPLIPSMILGLWLADFVGMILAGIMSGFDLFALNYYWKQEQGVKNSISLTFPTEYTRQVTL